MNRDVTAVIPTIPPRANLLHRALDSVAAQTMPVAAIAVAVDHAHEGGGATRSRALSMVQTEWTAFLDDDDEWLPHHVQFCLEMAEDSGADVIVPWFDVVGGRDPFPGNRACGVPQVPGAGMPAFPVTVLIRTGVARRERFPSHPDGEYVADEYHYFLRLRDGGATFAMYDTATLRYHHDSGNTSGVGKNW